MRGRSICRPDWLSIAPPGFTSMAARRRSGRSGIHDPQVADIAHRRAASEPRLLLARPRCDGGMRLAGAAALHHPRAANIPPPRAASEPRLLLARPRCDGGMRLAGVAGHGFGA